jgi:predicted nucleotidyltransferase
MNIDLSNLSQKEIVQKTNDFLRDDFLNKFNAIKDKVALIIVGSVANNDYDQYSDVDINVLLPEDIDNKPLIEYKEEIRKSGSKLELRFARNYEILEKYLNWNDDFILGEYQNGIVLQDPTKRFTELLKKFEWYPSDVFQNKIDWLFHEITYSVYELDSLLKRGDKNQFYVLVIKNKLIRYFLTAVRLLNKKYPVHDKRLFTTTIKQCANDFGILKYVGDLIITDDRQRIFKTAEEARTDLENYLLSSSLLTKQDTDCWLRYQTKNKNKILFD